jgi:O-antigen/teichoic acid export membrane protein
MGLLHIFSKNKFRLDISIDYISSFIELFIGLIIMTLINNKLGVQSYGVLITLTSSFSLISSFVSSNNQSGVSRFISIFRTKNESTKLNNIIAIGILIDFITCLLFLTLIFSIKFFFKNFSDRFYFESEIFNVLIFSMPFKILAGTFKGILAGFEKFKIQSLVLTFSLFIKLMIVLLTIKNGIKSVAYSYLIFDIIFFAGVFIFSMRHIDLKKIDMKSGFSELFNFIKLNFTSASIKAFVTKADIILLNYFTSSFIVGQYETIKKLFIPLNFIGPSLNKVLFPKFAKYSLDKNLKKVTDVIKKGTKYVVLISTIYICFIFFASNYYSYYQKIEIPKLMLLILSVYYFLSTSLWWGSSYFQNFDLRYTIKTNLILLLCTISFYPFFLIIIPNKLVGISMAILIAYIPPYIMGVSHLIKSSLT